MNIYTPVLRFCKKYSHKLHHLIVPPRKQWKKQSKNWAYNSIWIQKLEQSRL